MALDVEQATGGTLRSNLMSARDQGAAVPMLDDAPDLPQGGELIWSYFCRMSQYRGDNGTSENPITPTLLRDWCWMEGITLHSWELEALRQLDRAYLSRKKP